MTAASPKRCGVWSGFSVTAVTPVEWHPHSPPMWHHDMKVLGLVKWLVCVVASPGMVQFPQRDLRAGAGRGAATGHLQPHRCPNTPTGPNPAEKLSLKLFHSCEGWCVSFGMFSKAYHLYLADLVCLVWLGRLGWFVGLVCLIHFFIGLNCQEWFDRCGIKGS